MHDFDFLHGTWRVHNRRLKQRLVGCDEWITFDARAIERPLWGGLANVEEYVATLPDGTPLRGLALRLFDPATRQWTIHWASASLGTLDPPLTGAFADGVGTFYGRDTHEGRPVTVRFLWTHDGHDAARWEQAFSTDDGATWETNWIMAFTREREAQLPPVIELRHYTLHDGARDTLVDLFERYFVDAQDELGIRVLASFRDLDDPNAFTWLRGFPDMPSRAASLRAFYDEGAVWRTHRDVANGTMIDSDDVYLLRPVSLSPNAPGLAVATIYRIAPHEVDAFPAFFGREVLPRLVASGAPPVAALETLPNANTYPRLPVREGERAFVWIAHFEDADAHATHETRLASDPRWPAVRDALDRRLESPPRVWRLAPTVASRVLA